MEASAILSAMKGDKLREPAQWATWQAKVVQFAEQRDVWEYCDPDTQLDKLPKPAQTPVFPEYPEDGDAEKKREWRDRMDIFKFKHSQWEKQKKSLGDVNEYILSHLDAKYHRILLAQKTPYDRMVALKARFARRTAYEEELRAKWYHFAPQKASKDVNQWIDIWDTLREEVISVGIEVNDDDAVRHFLAATKDILPTWWQGAYTQCVLNREKREIRDLIEEFRNLYRELGPKQQSSSPKSAFSSWHGHDDANQQPQKTQTNKETSNKTTEYPPAVSTGPMHQRTCPCGRTMGNHKFRTCWYLRPELAPQSFQLREHTKQKVEKLLAADPNWRKWIDDEIRKHRDTQKGEALEVAEFTEVVKDHTVMNFCTITSTQIDSTIMSVEQKAARIPALKTRWILDSGATTHICNDKRRFIDFKPYNATMATGDGSTKATGIGTASLTGRNPETGEERVITLSDTVYAPGFHVSIVSYGKLKRKGATWCQETDVILDPARRPVVSTTQWDMDLWVFDRPNEAGRALYPPPETSVNTSIRHSVKPQNAKATAELWHRRFAHSNHQSIKKLAGMVEGVEITDDAATEETVTDVNSHCETCRLASAPRQISRRPIGRSFGRFGRVHFDLIQITPGFNRHRWLSHFYVEGVRFHWVMTHEFKPECQLAINDFVSLAKNWWNLPIKAFHYDNESAAGRTSERYLTAEGIIVYHSPPSHPDMNGYAERAGGMIILRMRMLILEGKLPKDLWPEAAYAAVWLLNRTPTFMLAENRWIVPWEEVRKDFTDEELPKINLSNVRLYGSLAYCRIQKQIQSDKMAPRAEIGFLVGFVASNIWRIWFPHTGKVQVVRDAVFDESRKYVPGFQQYQQIPMPIAGEPQVLTDDEASEIVRSIISPAASQRTYQESEESSRRNDEEIDEEVDEEAHREKASQPRKKAPELKLVTPSQSPDRQFVRQLAPTPAPAPAPASGPAPAPAEEPDQIPGAFPEEVPLPPTPPIEISQPDQGVESPEYEARDLATNSGTDDELEKQLQDELMQPTQEIFGDVDTSNIISGKRSRRPKADNDYAAHTVIHDEEPPAMLAAFAAGLYAEKPESRRHRDDLPPLPKHWKDVINHPFQEGFMAAMRKELDSLRQKQTYEVTDYPRDRSNQVLPLLWVFAYKFDQDGYLIKLKARICVRGDLETITAEEKRAATLAAKTARMIFALVAAYDLDLRQRDAVTAFLNSILEKETYTQMPEGFGRPGKCWKLRRALYGLRISPRLWQQEASGVLQKLGLRQVPEDPCVFVGNGILVFFYVDDILIASHPTARARAQQLERDLESHWELTDYGDAEWFLNIRIIRDRTQKKLWLCQDSYINSIAARYNLTERAPVFTPLPMEELQKYDGVATPREIHLYQQKVGSSGYATTITRVDAAKATAKLAQFLTNPGPQHQQAADRVITYLYSTRFHAIEYAASVEGMQSVQLASDASFGDHPDRKSSAGFICQVYGGPVDWKASKQPTVTTSTTEAELLGLTEAGKQLQWWQRLLKNVGFKPSHTITIDCDNERTVALIKGDSAVFDTKLRHVDIHWNWVRQEVQAGRIAIRWVPTARMVADGLTKVLTRQKHENFIRLLRLVDISHMIG